MQDTYDPFSFLLSEIRAFDTGERENWDPYQRQHYLDVLLADEAEEIAWGLRHLTLVHGRVDEVEADLLDDVYSAWEDVAARAAWSRIGGVPSSHMTITVRDGSAERLIAEAADVGSRLRRAHWKLLDTPIAILSSQSQHP